MPHPTMIPQHRRVRPGRDVNHHPGPTRASHHPSCCGARHRITSRTPPDPRQALAAEDSSWGAGEAIPLLQTLKHTQPVPLRTESCLSWEPHPTWGVLPSAPQRPAAHTPARSTSKVGARPPQASPPTRPTTGSQQIHVPLPPASRGPHAAGSPLCNNARIFTDLPLSSRTRAPDHLPSILLRPSLSAAETHAVSAGQGEPPYHLLGPSPPCWCLGTLKRHLPGSLLPGLGVGSTCLQPQGFRAG